MNRPLRALVLAAGLGTRLRPITINTPKCLVKICGQVLLERWLKQLENIGCKDILINTHYLSDQVKSFTKTWTSEHSKVVTCYEKKLLGTAGTLIRNQSFFYGYTGLLLHGDNVTSSDLKELIKAHINRPSYCLLTMLTFKTSNPSACGIVETDINGIVKSFHEKIPNPPSDIANGAIYVFDEDFLEWINELESNVTDFSKHVLPNLIGRIQTWHTSEPFMDIGTPDTLKEAQKVFKTIG